MLIPMIISLFFMTFPYQNLTPQVDVLSEVKMSALIFTVSPHRLLGFRPSKEVPGEF